MLSTLKKVPKRIVGAAPGGNLAALNAESSLQTTLVLNTSTPILVYNPSRNGLRIQADSANTTPVLLQLYNQSAATPTMTATAYHVSIPVGGFWDGKVGDVVWQGGVVAFATAAAKFSIASV